MSHTEAPHLTRVLELLRAANDAALLAPHTDDGFGGPDDTTPCVRCLAEAALLNAARARLRGNA